MSDIISYIPQGMSELKEFCNMVAKSTIVPENYRGKPENVFVACIKGMDLGLKPLQALECIAVINGKTSLYGDAYLAIARGSGRVENYTETIIGEGMDMKAVIMVKRRGEDAITGEYSAHDAKTAGLWGKTGPWTLHPKRMLTMKARNFALRAAFADLFLGMEYSAEDLEEVAEAKKAQTKPIVNTEPKDVTPIESISKLNHNAVFKIEEKFLTGIEVNTILQDKIDAIETQNDFSLFEMWKDNNKDGLKEFAKRNKEPWLSFWDDIEAKRLSFISGEK